MRPKICLFAALLCLFGCASNLRSLPAEVAARSQNQGVVVGSIVLQVKTEAALFPISLSEKQWHAVVQTARNRLLAKLFPTPGRVLDIKPDGKEVTFVSVLSPGMYVIDEMFTSGMDPNYRVGLRLKFSVEEKMKTYIGRLIITIPSHAGVLDTVLFKHRQVNIAVEDWQDDTMAILSKEYGPGFAEGIQKRLLTVR